MYERFFGLRERPFELTPDPHYLLLTPGHREALGMLQYGLGGRKGVIVLLGEAGTGKTTVLRAALDSLENRANRLLRLENPALTRAEFYELLASGFGLSARAGQSKAMFLLELRATLELASPDGVWALVVDEAQSAPPELLEEVRLFANSEAAGRRPLSIVLSGQPELGDRLNDPSLRQLKQRSALRCTLQALDADQTAAYVGARVRIAGGTDALFTADAVGAIHRVARGIPRAINVLCDNALVAAYAGAERPVTVATVMEAARDLDLLDEACEAPTPAVAAGAAPRAVSW
jgi:type II secretory pathway predicted ATPase ExeA